MIRALAAAAAVSLAWAAALATAPVLLRSPHAPLRAAAVVPYVVGSRVCHQVPARSFALAGAPLPVCARCTGLYAGVPLGIVAALGATRRARLGAATRARPLVAWAALPTALTVLVERAGVAPVPGGLRAASGAALASVAAFVVASRVRAEDRGHR